MGPREVDDPLESHGSDVGKPTSAAGRVREWVLLDGDRLLLAAGITIGTFLGLLALNALDVIAFVNDNSVTRLASGMVAGTFSLVTLVVSINQLILSQEFANAEAAREDFSGVVEFRRDVADEANVTTAPAEPTKLLEVLVAAIRHRAAVLADAVADHDDRAADLTERYAASVIDSADRMDETLERTSFGSFSAVSAAVAYDDAWQLYVARQLSNRHAETLPATALEALEDLIDSLGLFAVAREQFKTTYLQRELTRFSQLTIYTGVPAILSAMLVGLLYGDVGGAAIHHSALPVVVSALVAVVLAPLALLVAYILRTATVTRRTAATGPMLPEKDPEEGPFDVSYGDEGGE